MSDINPVLEPGDKVRFRVYPSTIGAKVDGEVESKERDETNKLFYKVKGWPKLVPHDNIIAKLES